MSDNDDLLGDDLGDHSLADYNLGNEEEEQLLADDYETGASQNVPTSMAYGDHVEMVPPEYIAMQYRNQPIQYQMQPDTECVVPNITVEVPNTPQQDHSTYAPYEPPPVYDPELAVVPPAIPAAPMESPQIVPSELGPPLANGDLGGPRERFMSERPPGAQRMPQVRDIPDSLDKVVLPRGMSGPRGRWRGVGQYGRYHNPFRRNNMHRANFSHRPQFPPPQMRPQLRHELRPEIRPDIRPETHDLRPEIRPDLHPEIRPDIREMRPDMLEMRPDMHEIRPGVGEIRPDMREIRPDMREVRPDMHEIRPDMRELRPDMREIRPDMRELRPDMREIRPDMREIRPDMREIRPDMREIRPDMREIRPDMREIRPDIHDLPPDVRHDIRPDLPQMGPLSPERPILPNMPLDPFINQPMEIRPFPPNVRYPFRPMLDEHRPPFPPMRPNFDRPQFFQRPVFHPRPFGVREVAPPIVSHIPQVTIRQSVPGAPGIRDPEVRMLPVQLPPNLPPGGLTGKKVLINPHFKGNFQPPVEGLTLPTYIPTRIQKSPPLSPTLENKFGPIKDINDAAERFIAEQRNALARAASRKFPRRSPQRYIENTTIQIENDLVHSSPPRGDRPGGLSPPPGTLPASVAPPRRRSEDDLLRRQEEFINANRAGLRRRMRSPSPRRSPSPPRRPRADPPAPHATHAPYTQRSDEESEYRRRMREQETLRERVLRAKEARRRKNAILQKQNQERERERIERENRDKDLKPLETRAAPGPEPEPTSTDQDSKPDTTRKSPEVKTRVIRERSPVRKQEPEVNSTCENLTPPRPDPPKQSSPERALTPPLPAKEEKKLLDSDDDLDLILGDIEGILSDDDDSGRFKEKSTKPEPPKPKPQTDLRTKLPPKPAAEAKRPRQKIVFHEDKKEDKREDKKKKEKSPPRKTIVTSSTKVDDTENIQKKSLKTKEKSETTAKSRQRIIFENKMSEKEEKEDLKPQFSNRRVILQRKIQAKEKSVFTRIEVKTDPTKPNPGIFSRAVRKIETDQNRIVIKKHEEPQVEYDSESDLDEDKLLEEELGNIAEVKNLPHGMTDTRLKTLAGSDVQSLRLDKEDRSAEIIFKTTIAAENFKKKFNNKMVAASRLTVALR